MARNKRTMTSAILAVPGIAMRDEDYRKTDARAGVQGITPQGWYMCVSADRPTIFLSSSEVALPLVSDHQSELPIFADVSTAQAH